VGSPNCIILRVFLFFLNLCRLIKALEIYGQKGKKATYYSFIFTFDKKIYISIGNTFG
jgi:hypothetical protein